MFSDKETSMTDRNVTDPGVCARCAAQGPTCCHLAPGHEEFCFPVSDMEKNRILEVMSCRGGFVLEKNSEAFVDNVRRLFPGEENVVRELFPESQSHYRLAIGKDGACRFLGASGCSIPREIRPYYCRLFPFWMVGNEVIIFDSESCLARREARTLKRMLDNIGITRADVRDLFGRLRLAWNLPPARGMSTVKKGF